eukprot:m.9107 g.9107  ORF g.9107 m.9107 type:complete len:417 (+) comp5425_c0_seq1:160-1410(+)
MHYFQAKRDDMTKSSKCRVYCPRIQSFNPVHTETSNTMSCPEGKKAKLAPFMLPPRLERPETTVGGEAVPAWADPAPAMCKHLLETSETEFDKLIDVVATQRSPYDALRFACRTVHQGTRDNYKDMIYKIGRNIYPLILASDNEPGLEGVGSTFTLFRRDGSTERICPCPPEYEIFKGLSHMSLGLFTFVSPFFKTPSGNGGWKAGLTGYHDKVKVALGAAQSLQSTAESNPEVDQQLVSHVIAMLQCVSKYITSCFESNTVDVTGFRAFTKEFLPLIEVSVANATRLQCEAALPALRRWKAELGSQWRDVYVAVPTVWPVGGYNPRIQLFEKLLDKDRVATHIIAMEGAATGEDARTTLGRVVGDRTVAHLVFGKETPNARALVCALSSRRDLVSSHFEDALREAGEVSAAAPAK